VPRVDDQWVDDQRVVSGILHVIHNGLSWRACLKRGSTPMYRANEGRLPPNGAPSNFGRAGHWGL
jgi:transposase